MFLVPSFFVDPVLGILQRCDHKLDALTENHSEQLVLNSESLTWDILLPQWSRLDCVTVGSALSCCRVHVNLGHVRTEACGLSRASLGHGNTHQLHSIAFPVFRV